MNDIVGNNIKKWRDHLGFSQDKIAEFLNISRENISYFENGEREVPVRHIERLADLFGIEPRVLYDEDMSLHETEMAFAFRNSENMSSNELDYISNFKRIVKNYLMMQRKIKKL